MDTVNKEMLDAFFDECSKEETRVSLILSINSQGNTKVLWRHDWSKEILLQILQDIVNSMKQDNKNVN
jgi:hypothetical protein